MNRIPTTATAQATAQSQYGQASHPSFLHVSHNSAFDLEAYIHFYVDSMARAERELAASRRSS